MSTPATTLKRREIGGWEVFADGIHIGWVVKLTDGWSAYVASSWGVIGTLVGSGIALRRDAIAEVVVYRRTA